MIVDGFLALLRARRKRHEARASAIGLEITDLTERLDRLDAALVAEIAAIDDLAADIRRREDASR